MQVACADAAMLCASHRSSLVLAIATALALGGLGTAARAQSDVPVPQPSSGAEPGMPGSVPSGGQPGSAPSLDVVPYHLRGKGELVPQNGALPIEAFTEHPMVEVVDENGTGVPGMLHRAGVSEHGEILAWVPNAPLAIGTITVTLRSLYETVPPRVHRVRVTAPFPNALPPIDMDVSASLIVRPEIRECCLGVPGGPPNGCFATRRESYVTVSPGFTSPVPSPFLDQYLFRIQPAPGSVDGEGTELFMPFEQVDAASFFQTADEYCLQVDALNIATQAISTYAFTACTEGVHGLVASLELNVALDNLEYDACPLPPDSQADVWCGVNADLCSGEDSTACAIRSHVCEGAPQPAIVTAFLSGQSLPAGDTQGGSSGGDPQACSAAPWSRSRGSLSAALWLLTLVALRLRRR